MITIQPKTVFAGVIAMIVLTTACVTDHRSSQTAGHANKPPTISKISDQETHEGRSKTVAFSVGDPDTPLDQLRLSALANNSALVPAKNIVLAGAGADRSLTILPATDQFGRTTITVEVSDGRSLTNDTFLFVVHPVHGENIILPQSIRRPGP